MRLTLPFIDEAMDRLALLKNMYSMSPGASGSWSLTVKFYFGSGGGGGGGGIAMCDVVVKSAT